MAHITGGGITDNLPRVLPHGTAAVVDASAWPIPPLFTWLRESGDVPGADMYRTFNMGIGLLTATAKENDNGTLVGSNLTQAATNTAGVDTIFADGAGISDAARDAAFSATDDYIVVTATLAAAKTSSIVLGDFGTGAAIPGATVQYCIAVTNSGSVAATGVAISDTLPAQVTYDAAYGVKVGGANCTTPGAGAGSFASGVVSGTIATLATSTTQTLIFRATIN
jgi:uncharacterized repeat protein (TIGR01451 family)